MAYQKGSFDSFKQKLSGGEYDSATGARRAIGKLGGLSDEEKDKARHLVDKHFGETSTTKNKPARAPAAKKEKVAAKPKTAAAPATRQPRTAFKAAPAETKKYAARTSAGSNTLEQLGIGERLVNSAVAALTTLQSIQNVTPSVAVAGTIEEYAGTLSSAVRIFRGIVADTVGPEVAQTVAPTQPVKQLSTKQQAAQAAQAAQPEQEDVSTVNGVDPDETEGGGRVMFPELQAH